MTASVLGPMLGGLAFVLFFGLWIAGIVFWIVMLVEVVRIPDEQYRWAGTEKTTWVLVVVLAQLIGALIWRFSKRASVLAATPPVFLAPPPGWYPVPGLGQIRWWDGRAWTEHSAPGRTP